MMCACDSADSVYCLCCLLLLLLLLPNTAVIIIQPLDSSVDLKAFCAVGQPDHDERGDLVVRYRDDKEWKSLATKLHPMQPDLKVGWVGGLPALFLCVCVCGGGGTLPAVAEGGAGRHAD